MPKKAKLKRTETFLAWGEKEISQQGGVLSEIERTK